MKPKFRHVRVESANLIVRRFEDVLEKNYQDQALDLHGMALAMAMSERQLQRKLRLLTGKTPSEYIRSYRLSRSLEYLLSGSTIRDTARAVGFSSQAYFASCFKSEYGRTPSEYRDRRQQRPTSS